MREFKFRAWHKLSETMHDHFDCFYGLCMHKEVDDLFDNPSDYIFMQNTGLEANNHKEIYEGDILLVDWGSEKETDLLKDYNKPFVMEFRNYSWFPFAHALPIPAAIEIIGNIYENPELLNEKK